MERDGEAPAEGEKTKKGLEPRAYLLWLLARRDYSRFQLEKKLRSRAVSEGDIQRLLDQLIEEGLFREEGFMRSRTRVLASRGLSRQRVRAKLRFEKVPVTVEALTEVFDELGIDEQRQIRELIDKHARRLLRRDPELKDPKAFQNRLIQSVLSRGHPYSVVKKIVDAKMHELKEA